ncbi:MAG: hypothetical protein HC849_21680 [Oscillatoriales cyanobacterium RU_3_3]|nr:hypothetical protein [Microcoleus sp. SU_5_3]NJM62218.1 hypothetical protein [Oscillatoriales cyanobacterium RU_3_3]
MITNITSQNALDRLFAINWQADDTRIQSHIALFREYLRRSAIWAKALNCAELWPFFDVAHQVCPDFPIPQDLVDRLAKHLAEFHLSNNIKQTCLWYLFFCEVETSPIVKQYAFPNPYEPLILMYDRGGIFYTEHGFFCVNIASFPRKDWSHYEHLTPLLQLESSVLDRLDLRETIA